MGKPAYRGKACFMRNLKDNSEVIKQERWVGIGCKDPVVKGLKGVQGTKWRLVAGAQRTRDRGERWDGRGRLGPDHAEP